MWEKKHAKDVGRVWTTNSVTKAIRKAETQQKYPAVIVDPASLPQTADKRKLSKLDEARIKVAKLHTSKYVTFTADTPSLPRRDRAQFFRGPSKQQVYQPGRHAAPLGLEWIDTSRVCNTIADLLNLKAYVTNSQAEYDALAKDSSLRPPSRYQGIMDLQPGLARMSEFIEQFLDGTATARAVMLELIKKADAIIVLVSEGDVVRDMNFSCSDDVEDEDYYRDEDVDQTRWTCLAECGTEALTTANLSAMLFMDGANRARTYHKICDWVRGIAS